MKLIYDKRDSGKARRIFELAKEKDAIILTENARALRVKAKGYGYGDELQIVDLNDYNPQNHFEDFNTHKIVFHSLSMNSLISSFSAIMNTSPSIKVTT